MKHSDIPPPFIFNPLKHHAGYLNSLINLLKNRPDKDIDIDQLIVRMGNAMVDVYTGILPISGILQDIRFQLEKQGLFNEQEFRHFINVKPGKFHNIQVSDGSIWTLLAGKDQDRYLHIHPARKSSDTIRVPAISLKTAFLLRVLFDGKEKEGDLVELVNIIRARYLKESPVKNASYTKRIQRILPFMKNGYQPGRHVF